MLYKVVHNFVAYKKIMLLVSRAHEHKFMVPAKFYWNLYEPK